MVQQKIEFRKIRDFGENLNDTFLFLRQHFAPLVKSFFAICAVFMVAQAIFSGIYQSQSFGFLDGLLKGRSEPSRTLSQVFSFEYFMVIILSGLTTLSMNLALGAYVKCYVEKGGIPGIDEVWSMYRKYFLTILAYSIPISLAIIIGTVFCFVPGIYLWVVFTPFVLVVMIEDKGFVATYDRCFELVHDNFWISFATYLVAYIIYSVGGFMIGAFVSAIAGLGAFLTTGNIGTAVGIVTSFLKMFSFCFYIIFFISVAFHYFNLVEKRDGTGILDRINTIGSGLDQTKDIEEQY